MPDPRYIHENFFLEMANCRNGLDLEVKSWFDRSSKLKTDHTQICNKVAEISGKYNNTDQCYYCLLPIAVIANCHFFLSCFSR